MQSQINIIPQYETKKILAKLKENYGISSFPENSKLAMRGKEKIFLFTGNINEKQISEIDSIAQIEGLGVYFGKYDDKNNIRLTIEGTQLFKNQITRNIVELKNKSQAEEWMMGRELLWEDIEKAISLNSNTPSGGRVTSRLEVSDGGEQCSRVSPQNQERVSLRGGVGS